MRTFIVFLLIAINEQYQFLNTDDFSIGRTIVLLIAASMAVVQDFVEVRRYL